MSTASPPSARASITRYNPTPYISRHKAWPYNASDFTRQDSSPDTNFYAPPRFVTHIDDAAIASLRDYYDAVLPAEGRILDFCSSWISHYPERVQKAVDQGRMEVVGLGMNKRELEANPVLNAGRFLKDLNEDPSLPAGVGDAEKPTGERGELDAATCVVSIDYLTQPVAVLTSLRRHTKTGGTVHLAISNRCFPTKAISRWLRVGEDERLHMVGDFLHFAGWERIEILDLKAATGKVDAADDVSAAAADSGSGVKRSFADLMRFMGAGGNDPLWVVRAVNPGPA